MKPILKIKIAVDAAMTVALLLLMAYGLVGEAAHEWIGMGMFALFVAHHVLNRRWIQAVPRGRYTPLRIVQTALAGLIFLCMVGSMISGIVLSRHVFAFLPKHGGYELAQQVLSLIHIFKDITSVLPQHLKNYEYSYIMYLDNFTLSEGSQ